MKVLPVSPAVKDYLIKRGLAEKYAKQVVLLENNRHHPSLKVELLEPKQHGIYSFRLDLKYRALFIFYDNRNTIEVLAITKHYH